MEGTGICTSVVSYVAFFIIIFNSLISSKVRNWSCHVEMIVLVILRTVDQVVMEVIMIA